MKMLMESGENYLETILLLKKEKGDVRSVDIAKVLNYSKASISRAVGIIKNEGFITLDEKGFIEFTEKGLEKANSIYKRHNIITNFLKKTLNIDAETAEKDACRIEHIISDKAFFEMEKYLNK